jgi:hypothetical protein
MLLLFFKVLPEEMLEDTCGVVQLNVVDNICAQRTACHCEMCGGLPECSVLEASNSTGLCCGGIMNCEHRRKKVSDTVCTADIGQCYSADLTYSLNGGEFPHYIQCALNDNGCKEFLESTLVGKDSFTCWHKRKDDDIIHLKSQPQPGGFVGGVIGLVICALEVICALIAPHLDDKFNKCRDCGRVDGRWGDEEEEQSSTVQMTQPPVPPITSTYPQRDSPSTSTSGLSTVAIEVDASNNV